MVNGIFVEQDATSRLDDRRMMSGDQQTQRALRDAHADGGLVERKKRNR
jgi:hypothetical protein